MILSLGFILVAFAAVEVEGYYCHWPFHCVGEIVIDHGNTLSAWSKWSTWHSITSCGPSSATYVLQTRERTRSCKGSGCGSEQTSQKQTRKAYVCKPVTLLEITLANYYWAPTTGYLTMKLRQGSTHCQTSYPTWKAPHYRNKTYYEHPVGCVATFDTSKKIDMWLTSDSTNDVYISKMGVKVGKVWKTWKSTSYKRIDKNYNNGWYTTSS